MEASVTQTTSDAEEWTVDQLAQRVELPVRTIREYQTLGLLPPPRRSGRVGYYGPVHRRRLELIARLRKRGHSLAGIGDLLGRWSDGADLGEVLGLEADQLVHVDEPGAPATLDQLRTALPDLVPQHLAELERTGVVERSDDGATFCVPSPSLLQLAADATAAGVPAPRVVVLLDTIATSANAVAEQVVLDLGELPAPASLSMLRRGRGLLAHGVGRLTLHRIGARLGIHDDADVDGALARIAKGR
jgi:DNA-binding transcriptional MerR regulator